MADPLDLEQVLLAQQGAQPPPAPQSDPNALIQALRNWWGSMDARARAQAAEYANKSAGDIGMEFAREAAPIAAGAAVGPVLGAVGKVAPALGRAGSAIASRFPMTTGAAEGGAAGGAMYAADHALSPADAAGPKRPAISEEERARTLEIQNELRANGFDVERDGTMGPKTQAAVKEFEARKAAKAQQDIDRQKGEAAASAAAADKARADAAIAAANADRDRIAKEKADAERKSQERKEGNERFEKMEKDIPWYQQALRDYGPLGAAIGGGVLGGITRGKVVSKYNAGTEKTAQRANQLMDDITPQSTLPERMGKVNQFYSEGQPRPLPFVGKPLEEPFPVAPGSRHGFQSNPNAPSQDVLYQQNKVATGALDAGIPLGAMGLATGTDMLLGGPARAERDKAYSAAKDDPSVINLKRLQTAKDNAALADALYQAERGVAGGYLGWMLKSRRDGSRPDVGRAEGQRVQLDREINAPPPMPPAPPPAPAAPPVNERPLRGAPGYKKTPWGIRGPGGGFSADPRKNKP